MELTLELELPDGSLRPLTVLGAERPTIAQIVERLAHAIDAGSGDPIEVDRLRLRSPRLDRELLGFRTLVREGIENGERLRLHAACAPPARGNRPQASVAVQPRQTARPAIPALLAAVGVGAVIACLAFGLAAVLDNDPSGTGPELAAGVTELDGSQPVADAAPDAAPAETGGDGVATGQATVATGDGAEGEDAEPAPEPEPLPAAFDAGEWVQLASFRSSAGAWAEAERLGAAGLDAAVIDSADAEELYPGFQVVVAGPFGEASERRRALRLARAAGIGDAKARTLTPAGTALDAATIAGSYGGDIELIDPSRPARNRTIAAGLFIDEDGLAQLSYEDLGCRATLEQSGLDGAVGTWRQTVVSGTCIKGGAWQIKLVDDELLMSWHRDGAERWMAARLTRDAG